MISRRTRRIRREKKLLNTKFVFTAIEAKKKAVDDLVKQIGMVCNGKSLAVVIEAISTVSDIAYEMEDM
jgi:hypothetical protein